jgi:hypothetical protein
MTRIITSIAFFAVLLFAGCNPSKKIFKNADDWIPADFNPNKTILLVEKYKDVRKVNQQMEEYMSENYSYKYEFVDKATIDNREGKYKDTKLYKYALIQTEGRKPGVIQKGEIWGGDFCFYDRENSKQYPATKRECSNTMMLFKPIINTLMSRY